MSISRLPVPQYSPERVYVAWACVNPTLLPEFDPAWIQSHELRTLYRSIAGLSGSGESVDLHDIIAELDASGELEQIGGARFVCEVWDEDPVIGDPDALALRVRDIALRRESAAIHQRAAEHGGEDADLDRLDEIERTIGAGRDAARSLSQRFCLPNSIAEALTQEPEPRKFLATGLLPEGESALLVAQGGTGKGHFEVYVALRLALGLPIGPFSVPAPRGTLILSAEEDIAEFHRRLWYAWKILEADVEAAIDVEWARQQISSHVKFVPLRGLPEVCLGNELRKEICAHKDDVEHLGMSILDPLGRFLPQGVDLNGQSDAGRLIGEQDAITVDTGAACMIAYHVSKGAVRTGTTLEGGASSGSMQLEDLSRLVLNFSSKQLPDGTPQGAPGVAGLVTKTNYTAPMVTPFHFARREGGALEYVEVEAPEKTVDEMVIQLLWDAGQWLSRDEWRKAATEKDISKHDIDGARSRLKSSGEVEEVTLRKGERVAVIFAPAGRIGWPPEPTFEAFKNAGRK